MQAIVGHNVWVEGCGDIRISILIDVRVEASTVKYTTPLLYIG